MGNVKYMIPPLQKGNVAASQVVPASQVVRSGETLRNAAHAPRGATYNAVATPVGPRALILGQHKSRLQSLLTAMVYDDRGII
ncbi:hypothetical protein DPMN_011385 [Dreissena polymorpha]|uniref:Uncharacterized protein n=1 Tax=Dreissena polymorpha TaxID=45954 RepID=A0A9D4RZY3_DREPO|nr:hypothetical protein DPMN_011385 [Dreissena polymorpha]